jgi:small subunit ribosomal protein S17
MKAITGVVTSNKMKNTATVSVARTKVHRLYKKILRSQKKFHAHDEIGVQIGDRVKIQSVRPISKTVKYKIIEVIKNEASHKEAK